MGVLLEQSPFPKAVKYLKFIAKYLNLNVWIKNKLYFYLKVSNNKYLIIKY